MKPSKPLDLALSRYATKLDELSLQEGRPLAPSDEEEAQATSKMRNCAPEREIFMVRVAEIQHSDDEGLEHVQFGDYHIDDDNYYFSDTPVQNTDTRVSFDSHGVPEHALDAIDTV
jgi:hypothetical protein